MINTRRFIWISIVSFFLFASGFTLYTILALSPPPRSLAVTSSTVRKAQLVDRNAIPLITTYQNDWNIHEYVPLHQIPEILQKIFILAEDKRFFEHHGFDWRARLHALAQDITARRIVRGASTITEQTVRLLHPRPRTFWSRWLEGFEAIRLENRFSKADILEFYLNQVPYANHRRGVVQAARHYFNRNLSTLNLKEMIALAVLVRAPSRFDLYQSTHAIEPSIKHLVRRLLAAGLITQEDYQTILISPLQLQDSHLPVQATHFVRHVYASQPTHYLQAQGHLRTTLEASLQQAVQNILDNRLHDLHDKNVNNGAILVVDNRNNNEVIAWVNANASTSEAANSEIDAITTPRQPGSTLKPFLYALALEKGWTTATLIDDAPITTPIGTGIHNYRNYSRHYYGSLRLREALGNSLNTPAIRTIQFVGPPVFLTRLHQLGMTSLTAPASYYGDGLALGNGNITLLELVQAYATLANQGRFRPLKVLDAAPTPQAVTCFSTEISSLIADILSDSDARRLEFGSSELLRLPVQTAVKTGTSTDYRDAWAVGFNYRYTVGVWLGNLNQQPMLNVSGASGAALLLRTIFAELNRHQETQPLYLSPRLVNIPICRNTGQVATNDCSSRGEWFIAGTEPLPKSDSILVATQALNAPLRFEQPSDGLQLAVDPRIPDEHQAFALKLSDTSLTTDNASIEWLVDGKVIGNTSAQTRQFLWPVKRGTHSAQARVRYLQSQHTHSTPEVTFYVK